MTIYKNIEKFYDWYDKYSNNEFGTYLDNVRHMLIGEINAQSAYVQNDREIFFELAAHQTVTELRETYLFKEVIEEIDGSYQQTFIF